MLRLSKNSKVDFDKYLERLSYLGYIYYNLDKIEYPISRLKLLKSSLSDYIYRFLLEASGGSIVGIQRSSVKNYLLNVAKVPESLLTVVNRKDGNNYTTISIDAEHLTAAKDRGFACEFVDMWLEYTSLTSQIGLIEGLMSLMSDSVTKKNSIGQTLYGVSYNISYSDAFRTYYKNFAHQQVPKQFLSSLDAPAGYTMVKGDFGQSDLKIVYNMLLKDKSNIDTMFRFPDSYEGMARLTEGSNFSLETFKKDRDLYKQNTLSPIYGGTSASTAQAQKIIDNVNRYLENLPVYQDYKKRIQKKIDCGLPVVLNTYFGNSIEIVDFDRNSKKIMDKALNTPAQAGTSEVVIMCANSILDKFEEYGITPENGGVYLYLNRHDELVFLLNNEYLEYSWIFQENEDILIEGWMPLRIEFSFTDNYLIDNPEIDRLAKTYYKTSEPINIDKLIESALKSEYFIPCEDTKVYYIGIYSDGGSSCVVFLNENKDVEMAKLVNSDNKDVLLGSIVNIIGEKHLELLQQNCTSVCVYTTMVTDDISVSKGLPIILKSNFSDAIYRTAIKEAKLRFDKAKNS